MPQYLSPGVYVQEVPSAVQPIAGVGTSTAGFIGVVEYGEVEPAEHALLNRTLKEDIGEVGSGSEVTTVNVGDVINAETKKKNKIKVEPLTTFLENKQYSAAKLCTNFAGFTKHFGGFTSTNKQQNWLAHAVYGYFNNGGTRCWVTRAAQDSLSDALETFKPIDEISLVAIPGATDKPLQTAILDHCEDKNLQDRFAILDAALGKPDDLTAQNVFKGVRSSKYAAIYFPWIKVFDPAAQEVIAVPPSGHIAGIYARVDAERGVHKAPANEVIRGALDVDTPISRRDQDGLNPDGVNVIRKFNGNITVWGARTIGGERNGEWKYINVRRLFIYLRESIDQGTQWVVFEPNTPELWAKITRNITAFLTNVWRDGALFGNTPQEAFYVKCDAEINPPEVRDLGQVVTEIGVAVVKPAEFVIFRISQWAGPGE